MGEYEALAKTVSTYQMGTKAPAMKRVARNAWTGTPNMNFPVDHVVALHDGGAQINRDILVMSPDANMISLIRSNFGNGVMGMGMGDRLIEKNLIPKTLWDYVYYPTGVVMNTSSKFEEAVKGSVSALRVMMESDPSGTNMLHFSPLLFFCKEVADAFGVKYGEPGTYSGGITTIKKEYSERVHLPTEETSYPMMSPRMIPANYMDFVDRGHLWELDRKILSLDRLKNVKGAKKIEYDWKKSYSWAVNTEPTEVTVAHFKRDKGSLYQSLSQIKTYTMLSSAAVAQMKLPMTATMNSYRGTMLWCGKLDRRPFGEVIGEMISVMREAFRAIWMCRASSLDQYHIRLFCKAASVAGLVLDDEYSPLYDKDTVNVFAEEEIEGLGRLEEREVEIRSRENVPVREEEGQVIVQMSGFKLEDD